jgi:hypothetical protein
MYFMELRPARFCDELSNFDGKQKARWDEEICIALEAFCRIKKESRILYLPSPNIEFGACLSVR